MRSLDLSGAERPNQAASDARGCAVAPGIRVAFAHAALQWIASVEAVDTLHIKGTALDPAFGRTDRGGSDADVLVRPSHVARYLGALRSTGWTQVTTFGTDSDFGSAVTLRHRAWGIGDVHRYFPGIGASAEAAFELLWRDRLSSEIAGVACPVPSITAQAVVLVLNAARAGTSPSADVATAWGSAPPERRQAMTALVADLGAEVAFAAATGELERYRGAREYDLWRIESQGGTRIAKWRARIKAAPTVRGKARLALRAPLVNTDHVAVILGRPPTRREVVREFFARPARGLREEGRAFVVRMRERCR